MEVKTIVLTGGPCAGKTSALCALTDFLEERGWKVIALPEEATTLISSGIRPWDFDDASDFQCLLIKNQIAREDNVKRAAIALEGKIDKLMIVCDRGACDTRAYVGYANYLRILDELHETENSLLSRYDAVFHLVTAADGAEEAYSLANNKARTETPERARQLDLATQNAWVGHHHLRIIRNDNVSFKEKLANLCREVAVFLGEPEPFEIERKYLIKRPDLDLLEHMSNCRSADILQTYLTTDDGSEMRVRQRGSDGSYDFTLTQKFETGSAMTRIEIERRLTEREYLNYLMRADASRRPIRKRRYYIMEREQGIYLELDVFESETEYALLEVELPNEDTPVCLPSYIELVREVTDDLRYRNRYLSANGCRLVP